MNSFRSFQEDDEDDTHLFTEAERYVLKHHPNPDRIGCPGPGTLSRFVESPGQVDLSEMNDLHVLHCAECTRDLMELRRERQRRLELEQFPHAHRRKNHWTWASAAIAASIFIGAISFFLINRTKLTNSHQYPSQELGPVAAMIDLSGDGVSRGAEDSSRPPIPLSARLLDLHVRLPYFSPSGTYRVFLSREKTLTSTIVFGTARAIVNGPRTDLKLRLDLSKVTPGSYFLGTQRIDADQPYYYPVTLN